MLCGRQASKPDARQKTAHWATRYGATQPEQALAEVAARWQASAIVVQTGTSLLPMVVRSLATGPPTAVYLHTWNPPAGRHADARSLLRYFANLISPPSAGARCAASTAA